MKNLSRDGINTLLSQYLDGMLNDADRSLIEGLIARDQTVKQQFEHLKRLKELLSGQKKIEPNFAFWTRLSASLQKDEGEDTLLPFPRRYVPSAAVASVVGVLLIGMVIYQNRMSMFHFITQKTHVVQSAYEEGILKGTILPLFAHIDNNQVLQFSLLGVLPLDSKSDMAIKVDQNAKNGYQIKLGKTVPKAAKPITVSEFYSEIQATRQQKDIIDSLVGLARKRIESSVLVSENHAVAIDPELAELNKVMVSNIASCLEPFQRVQFGRFLERKDAPYTFVSRKFVPANPESIYAEMSRVPSAHRFVVVTEDTATFAHVNTEIIRQIQQMPEISTQVQAMARQNLEMAEQLLRHYADREPQPGTAPQVAARPFEIWKDANAVGIVFQQGSNEPVWGIQQPVVVPMPRRVHTFSVSSPTARIEFGIYGDSVTAREVMVDSAMVRFFDNNNAAEYNLRMMDSIFSSLTSRFQMHPGTFPLDSVFRAVEDARRKAFEEGKQRHDSLQREVRLRKKEPSSNDR